MPSFVRAALLSGFALMAGPLLAEVRMLEFGDLAGWDQDNQAAALQSFLGTCDLLQGPEWGPLCGLAQEIAATQDSAAARSFFQTFFRPVQIGDPPALFTGYYEPELEGSLSPTSRFAWPVYRRPPELKDGTVWHDRATIERGVLRGRGLEIAWLKDPVEVFFLHIQGSGRIRLPDGQVIRVGYAGRNGHGYESLGQGLLARGLLREDQLSAPEIAAYVRRTGRVDLLNINPSYVFFRRLDDLPPEAGPIGAMGRSITAMRSVAVDPAHVPLGAPVWIDKSGATPFASLMVAQDTGGAIKGAQRADIFFGSGEAAGAAAGVIRDGGRMVVLLPIDRAYALLPAPEF